MKKRTVIWLIVAAVLILSGSAFFTAGLATVDFDPAKLDQLQIHERAYIVNESFDSIRIDATDCDVTIVKTDEDFQVVCPDSEKFSYTVSVEDNTLQIRQVDLHRWYDFIGIHLGKMVITVYLPESQYDLLRIDTDTGDIFVTEDFSFGAAEIFTSTGDVRFSASVSERLNAGTSTGNLTICGSSPDRMQISTSTGNVAIQDTSCVDCFVKTTTGDLALSSLTCQTLDCQSDTGNQYLESVTAENYIKAISNTGDVDLLGCDAQTITIETDTGDITGVLLSPKEFFAHTDTGEEQIPDHSGTASGQCYVNSNTGDITFSYQP